MESGWKHVWRVGIQSGGIPQQKPEQEVIGTSVTALDHVVSWKHKDAAHNDTFSNADIVFSLRVTRIDQLHAKSVS